MFLIVVNRMFFSALVEHKRGFSTTKSRLSALRKGMRVSKRAHTGDERAHNLHDRGTTLLVGQIVDLLLGHREDLLDQLRLLGRDWRRLLHRRRCGRRRPSIARRTGSRWRRAVTLRRAMAVALLLLVGWGSVRGRWRTAGVRARLVVVVVVGRLLLRRRAAVVRWGVVRLRGWGSCLREHFLRSGGVSIVHWKQRSADVR